MKERRRAKIRPRHFGTTGPLFLFFLIFYQPAPKVKSRPAHPARQNTLNRDQFVPRPTNLTHFQATGSWNNCHIETHHKDPNNILVISLVKSVYHVTFANALEARYRLRYFTVIKLHEGYNKLYPAKMWNYG